MPKIKFSVGEEPNENLNEIYYRKGVSLSAILTAPT
jgi:hypothetical protein